MRPCRPDGAALEPIRAGKWRLHPVGLPSDTGRAIALRASATYRGRGGSPKIACEGVHVLARQRNGVHRLALALVLAILALELTPGTAAAESATEQVLVSFSGTNGAGPLSGVIVGPGGVLYGTTIFGGQYGGGSVFSLTPAESGRYTEKVLFSFDGTDGLKPAGNVIPDGHGNLYGTTFLGGEHNWGTVYELTPTDGGWVETVLYSFTGLADGQEPIGAPALDSRGNVFGLTGFGGFGGHGVVFEVKRTQNGYAEIVLHDFPNTGSGPQAGLTRAADGTLYGTTYGFSSEDENGSVFCLRLTKSGPIYQDLYDFQGGADGANPFASLLVDDNTGTIYGTTEYGGAGTNGTVFSLTPGRPGYTEQVLHSFVRSHDGVLPRAPLLETASGDLYHLTADAPHVRHRLDRPGPIPVNATGALRMDRLTGFYPTGIRHAVPAGATFILCNVVSRDTWPRRPFHISVSAPLGHPGPDHRGR